MKRPLLIVAFTLITGSAALAQGMTQPHCNEGSHCQAATEDAAHPNPVVQSTQDTGPTWELDPVSPNPGSVAMCTATEGCDPVIRTPVIVENNCALSQVESLIGHPIEITEEYHLSPRVFSAERMAGTTDYWPRRFNVFVDADGMITQAFCG